MSRSKPRLRRPPRPGSADRRAGHPGEAPEGLRAAQGQAPAGARRSGSRRRSPPTRRSPSAPRCPPPPPPRRAAGQPAVALGASRARPLAADRPALRPRGGRAPAVARGLRPAPRRRRPLRGHGPRRSRRVAGPARRPGARSIGPEPHRPTAARRSRPRDLWGHDHCWWLDRMVRSDQPLVERMTLIWHDWFATSTRQGRQPAAHARPERDLPPQRARRRSATC